MDMKFIEEEKRRQAEARKAGRVADFPDVVLDAPGMRYAQFFPLRRGCSFGIVDALNLSFRRVRWFLRASSGRVV